ncbi:MAG TPA: hypothetical protein V6D17_10610 [Candidatus Obscuribacterales bacterium]
MSQESFWDSEEPKAAPAGQTAPAVDKTGEESPIGQALGEPLGQNFGLQERAYRNAVRHIMAAILVQEELRVPVSRGTEPVLADERLRKQFRPLIENTYCIVDLMMEIGEGRNDSNY